LKNAAPLTRLQFRGAVSVVAAAGSFFLTPDLIPPAGVRKGGMSLSDLERTMLSPHEFATLLLVKDAPNQVDMEREELDSLLERQLVELEKLASGRPQWRVTEIGDTALRAIKRLS
jgi:hypothetical protein